MNVKSGQIVIQRVKEINVMSSREYFSVNILNFKFRPDV